MNLKNELETLSRLSSAAAARLIPLAAGNTHDGRRLQGELGSIIAALDAIQEAAEAASLIRYALSKACDELTHR